MSEDCQPAAADPADTARYKTAEESVKTPPANPDARKPHLWGAFALWLLWKKFSILAEPAGISLLLYAMYRTAWGMYYSVYDGYNAWDMAEKCILGLLVLVGLSKIVRIWLKLAWEKRPLSIALVLVACVLWYDGIPLA